MNSRCLKAVLASAFGSGVALALLSEMPSGGLSAEETMNHAYECIPAAAALKFSDYRRQMLTWPTSEKIERDQADPATPGVKKATESTKHWLTNIFQAKWTADLSGMKLLAVHNDVDGNDTIRFRFEVGKYAVQGSATSAAMIIVIVNTSNNRSIENLDLSGAKEMLASKIDEFLNHAEDIIKISMGRVTSRYGGIFGEPDIQLNERGDWWGMVDWWTDGERIVFGIYKADGGPRFPSINKNWFSAE